MYKAISADGFELKEGDIIFDIYHPKNSYSVGGVFGNNYIYVRVNDTYSHSGNSKNYSKSKQFAIKNAIKYHSEDIQKDKEKLKGKEDYLLNLISQLSNLETNDNKNDIKNGKELFDFVKSCADLTEESIDHICFTNTKQTLQRLVAAAKKLI